MDFICSTTCSILRPQLRQVMSDMKPDSQYQYKKQSICQVSARIFPSNTKLTVCSPLSSVSNLHHPYQKGGTLLVNLRFSPGSSVAGGASIIQLGWTIAARLAPQLPCSRQIRQRTKLFMMEEWKDGNRWNHRAPVSHLTNERVIFTNEFWLFRSGVSTFLKSNLEMYYNNCQN